MSAAPTPPVIVVSIIGDEELARSLGANRHITKPLERDSFLTAVDELLS